MAALASTPRPPSSSSAWLVAAGSKGSLGAAFGLALAVAFFSATLLRWGRPAGSSRTWMLPAAVVTFPFKMTVIGRRCSCSGTRPPSTGRRSPSPWSPGRSSIWRPIRFAVKARVPCVVTDEKRAGCGDRFARP